MGELNLIPQVIVGYHPAEIIYQVRKQSLFIYLRLVEYHHHLQGQLIEKTKEVDVVEVPLSLLGIHLKDKINTFEESVYPNLVKSEAAHGTFKTYVVNNLVYTIECFNGNETRFKITYDCGLKQKVNLLEGSVMYSSKTKKVIAQSKNNMLKKYVESIYN